ncbi:methyltransferase family protein [Anaerobacterium chartisolvens]|uniref:Methyltransferase family protein n=1 Tax=Anaerobacterium chartisolvens TaxID=1297424 RepID=A0A369B507_9FIRM|nr:methyltransferase domain-containing protein [Anaerobacterium chartisolvens]RCX16612.1 methyltransferase family protein [Anaerobacterium chartisolvens]
MDYINNNKSAWEEAFEHRQPSWGDDNYKILMNEKLPFLNADVVSEIEKIGLKGKTIGQFCCNNGRELLSMMQLNPSYGVGFDIAENIIEQAKETARKANITNCDFVTANIMDIDENYYNKFDFIFFTIGAITWFKDLSLLLVKASKCLKSNGLLLINDSHPFMNMLPLPHEDGFDGENLNQITYSYYRKEPWVENSGMGYMTPQYESKTFTSFSHTLSDIVNSVITAGIAIKKLNEYDYDVGLTNVYDKKGYPLSFILLAQK